MNFLKNPKLSLVIFFFFFVTFQSKAQLNTAPLPAGETKIGGHLHSGASNEVWTDATSLYFNYRGNAVATHFWNLDGGTGKTIMSLLKNGNVGIGTSSPLGVLDVRGTTYLGTSGNFIFHANNELNYKYDSEQNEGWWINYRGTYNKDQFRDFYLGNGKGESVLMVDGSISSIGIGTNTPTEKLDVRGTIKATEIKVQAQTADFVFEEDYQLKSLEEVEQFVKTNNHLPDIPSAKEMKEDGVGLAEMNKLLLQKVEELTLYIIEMKKENVKQQKEIEKLIRDSK
ncbi:hypothetical protein [Labilibaculum euxinus]